MKGLPPLGALRRSAQTKFKEVREARFFRDRISVSLLLAGLIVSGLGFVLLMLHVPPTHTDIPVRYSSLGGGFEGLGPWYSPYLIMMFGLAIVVINGVLAFRAFVLSRLASFYLLAGAAVVSIFCLIVANAFATVSQ
jgi:hypothetical protein